MELVTLAKRLERLTIDNSPAILTAFGVVGTLSTAYLTGKATVKAVKIIEAEKKHMRVAGEGHPIDTKEAAKLVWKLYIPPAVSAVGTIVAIVGSNHVSSRRAAGMAAAYSISERAFYEYKDKVVEKLGEKKAQEIRDDISQDRMARDQVSNTEVIITDNGDVLCYDCFTGRYFKSSMETLRAAENDVNHLILNQGYASVSDLYEVLDLPITSYSDEVGWNTDRLLKFVYSTVMSDDGRPCISIDFDLVPHRKYAHFAGES